MAINRRFVVTRKPGRGPTYTDSLTGLANRRELFESLAAAIAEPTGAGTAVLLIDVDDFKSVNDRLGHAAGDGLLMTLGRRLRAKVRFGDTVARVSGDRFAVIVRSADVMVTAAEVADRLVSALSEEVELDGHRVRIACSVGIADTHGTTNPDDVMRHAEAALYVAKSRGKDCVEVVPVGFISAAS